MVIESLADVSWFVKESIMCLEGCWTLGFFLVTHKTPETASVICDCEKFTDIFPVIRFGSVFDPIPNLFVVLPVIARA